MRIRIAPPSEALSPAPAPNYRHFKPPQPDLTPKPLAAFENAMSEPLHQIECDFDYWMNTDLMDACFDPLHDGMGLDSHKKQAGACQSLEPNAEGNFAATASLDGLGNPPDTSGDHSKGLDLNLSPSLGEGLLLQFPSGDASMSVIGGTGTTANRYHKEYVCQTCGASFRHYPLIWHAKETGHFIASCTFSGCGQIFATYKEKEAHERRPHTSGHSRILTATPFDCVECGEFFSSKANLLRHAKEKQHQPYSCECGAVFSRLDVLNRHLESVGTETPKYPCILCKRHRGTNGFRRRDHLTQHLRNYHHLEANDESTEVVPSRLKYYFPVCSHSDCPYYRDESFKSLPRRRQEANKPFPTQGAFTKHMREEHNECMFPCDVQGCDRIGRRGYFREKDMIKHRMESHPDACSYQPTKRELKTRCTEPGCGAPLDPSSLRYHLISHYHALKHGNLKASAKQMFQPSSSDDAAQMQSVPNVSSPIDFDVSFESPQNFGF